MIDHILSRLQRVRTRLDGSFAASCPTSFHEHGDRSQGLRIKSTEDGTVLIHCPAGCRAEEIMGAIGLTLADLYPPRSDGYQPSRAPVWPARDLIQIISHEALIAHFGAQKLANGEELTEEDRQRLFTATNRIQAALSAGGIHVRR